MIRQVLHGIGQAVLLVMFLVLGAVAFLVNLVRQTLRI